MFEQLSGVQLTLFGLAIYLLVCIAVAWLIMRKGKHKSAWRVRREAEQEHLVQARRRDGHPPEERHSAS